MERITMTAHFRGEAAAPSGEPPETEPRATSVAIEAVMADGSDAGIERASTPTSCMARSSTGSPGVAVASTEPAA